MHQVGPNKTWDWGDIHLTRWVTETKMWQLQQR
jgi:hypothetical protein